MKINFQQITKHLHDGLYLTDKERKITYWNQAAERITGYTADEVIGRSCADNILMHVDQQGTQLCLNLCPLAKTMQDQQPRQARVFLKHKLGHRVAVQVRTTPLLDDNDQVIGGIELFTDSPSEEDFQEKISELEKLALLDPLTNLPNRRFLDAELESQFGVYLRNQTPFGILMLDIDHFKQINDTHGHQLGDQALKVIADTLQGSIRTYDIMGRWGGEEFLGIFPNTRKERLGQISNRLLRLVEKSYIIHEGERVSVTVTIGGSVVDQEDTLESLIERADQRLYQGKRQGRNQKVLS